MTASSLRVQCAAAVCHQPSGGSVSGREDIELQRRCWPRRRRSLASAGPFTCAALTLCTTLRDAVAFNGSQQLVHAALQALNGLRRVTLLLPLAAPPDMRYPQRIQLLVYVLGTLESSSPTIITPLTSPLASMAHSLYHSVERRWLLSPAVILQLLKASITALAPPRRLTPEARTCLYLLLLDVVEPLRVSTPRAQLKASASARLRSSMPALFQLLAHDCCEGLSSEVHPQPLSLSSLLHPALLPRSGDRAVSLSFLTCLVHFEASTREDATNGLVAQLTNQVTLAPCVSPRATA
jgi:hypothetical protein